MALGTVTLVADASASERGIYPLYYDRVTVVGPASYTAGGEDFLALFRAQTGNNREPVGILPQVSNGYVLEYDTALDKLRIYHFDYDAGGDGAAVEPTGADLSGVTFTIGVLSR